MYSTFCFTEKSSAPKFGFGSSMREKDYLKEKKKRPQIPGPGRYESKVVLGEKAGCPAYSMPSRKPDLRPKTGKDAPDAGNYDPSHRYSSIKLSVP
jgi:hypothetical protein